METYQTYRQRYMKTLANLDLIALIIASSFLGVKFGWQVGWGIGLLAWIFKPIREA